MYRFSCALVLSLATMISTAAAAGICDPQVIAAMKNTEATTQSFSERDKLFRSFCSSASETSISLPLGGDVGRISGSSSATKACLTSNNEHFLNAESSYLVSTLPESVQENLIFACGIGGLQFSGSDKGNIITLKAKYVRASDGFKPIPKLLVNSLVVLSADGTKLACEGHLATSGKHITSDGIDATCVRGSVTSQLLARVDASTETGEQVSESISLSGKEYVEIRYKTPSVKNTDGRMWTCVANDGAYQPGGAYDCHYYRVCDNSAAKAARCAAWHGTHFEIGPAGAVWVQYRDSYRRHKNGSDCIAAFSSQETDVCVTARRIIHGAEISSFKVEYKE